VHYVVILDLVRSEVFLAAIEHGIAAAIEKTPKPSNLIYAPRYTID
jgi:hypothetical protein